MIQKFTPIQKERVERLENQLEIAASKGDVNSAKIIILDLQPIFNSTGNTARLMQAKARLFEANMEQGEVNIAISGLIGIRTIINKHTRTFLEATALLAICYLRIKDLLKAEPLIREVLINDKVISSITKRAIFRKNMIERFDEEGLLFALKGSVPVQRFDSNEIEHEVSKFIQSNQLEDKYFENIGNGVPNSAKQVLLKVDEFSKKQLPTAERIALPSGKEMLEDKKIGKTLFKSIKRTIYKSICDKDSEVYKGWYTGGLAGITSLITTIVADAFHKLNIGIRAVIVMVSALIIKFGINVYCEHYKPVDIMHMR